MKSIFFLLCLIPAIFGFNIPDEAYNNPEDSTGFFTKSYFAIKNFITLAEPTIDTIIIENGTGPEIIDVLDYLIPDETGLELIDPQDGEARSTVVIGNAVIENKYNLPKLFELYKYDPNYIYINQDNRNDQTVILNKNNPLGSIYLPRKCKVGTHVKIRLYDAFVAYNTANCQPQFTANSEYEVWLSEYWPEYDLCGDLGKDKVILVKWKWGWETDAWEYFFFSKKYGWVKYENRSGENGSYINYDRIWNKNTGNKPTLPIPSCFNFPIPESRYNSTCGIMKCSGRACFEEPSSVCTGEYNSCFGQRCCKWDECILP